MEVMKMTQAHQILFEEISKLPLEKLGKALSYVRYLGQEPEAELFLEPVEEKELYEILAIEDGINSSEMFAMIEGLPDD
jgi:hypothetical protein